MTAATPSGGRFEDESVVWLVDGPDELEAVVSELCACGYARCPDALPSLPFDLSASRLVRSATVGADDPGALVLAATRGVTLVLTFDVEDLEREALLDTLARVGRVREWSERRAEPSLSHVHTALLDLLAQGASLQDAAARSFVSLRTANRRLSEARVALGAANNRAAVVHWSHRSTP